MDLPDHIRHGFVRNPPDHKGTHYFRCLHCGTDRLFAVVVGDEAAKVGAQFVSHHGSCKPEVSRPMTVSDLIAELQRCPQDSMVLLEVAPPGDRPFPAVRVTVEDHEVLISGDDD